ncbi:histidinol-phosphate transaminase [Thiomicrospira sp. R3]|uniref:histidinol-phosphate transaminase n=1 Tax=Thiomicrospira sp. R3 TaxID=3035472 RepID=UPI00259BEDDD|nr:histidinol-phosphate transaminase [Thiomicrospira sp. R3]WFE68590.1 histidinol-phosphate transaminase [Thiomicrospira sp. R3]
MSGLFQQQIQPQIQSIKPYIPGKPVSELQRELGLSHVTKLASNENPLGASEKALAAIEIALKDVARYPDGNGFYLRSALAEFNKVALSQVAIGNGSNELLELVGRVFAGPGDEIIYSQYGFAVYPITAQIVGAVGVEVAAKDYGHDLEAMAKAVTPRTKIIYVANPNNPTGSCFGREAWEAFIQSVPQHVIVVLDEAYIEYVDDVDYPSGLDYLAQYPNLILSRTFSKAYGLASLRVGYMLASEELIAYISRLRAPFNVNHFAQVAAVAALHDQQFVQQSVELNRQGKHQIINSLSDRALDFIPSQGNFICVKFGENAAEINQRLLHQGVIVRPVANYGLVEFLRVSIGTYQENQHFIDALSKVL